MLSDLEKSERNYNKIKAEEERLNKKFDILLHRRDRVHTAYKLAERRARTHRLIEQGAVFESLIPKHINLTNEQKTALLKIALSSEDAFRFMQNVSSPS